MTTYIKEDHTLQVYAVRRRYQDGSFVNCRLTKHTGEPCVHGRSGMLLRSFDSRSMNHVERERIIVKDTRIRARLHIRPALNPTPRFRLLSMPCPSTFLDSGVREVRSVDPRPAF